MQRLICIQVCPNGIGVKCHEDDIVELTRDAACQGAKWVSRASKTIKHKTKYQACRWFLGPQETQRLEVQEARSKDSRKGLLVGPFGETILQDCMRTPHAAHKRIWVAA
jgi:hypothetical protein